MPPSSAGTFSEFPYREHFERYGRQYLPDLDPRWFAAQAKQESNFDRFARSRVGAMGVMQLLPGTFAEQSERLGVDCSPWSPRCSIQLGIHYDRRMALQFKRDTWLERVPWMLASYNEGLGNVLRHQRACGGSRKYADVAPCLYPEARDYVERIYRNFFGT